MHHTRRTHNAHKETPRRLNKVLSNSSTYSYYPPAHYTYPAYGSGRFYGYRPYWDSHHDSNFVHYRGEGSNFYYDTLEEMERVKKHRYLVKKSRSSGRKSYYGYAKKYVHRHWRRKGFDEHTYSLKGISKSWQNINW